MDARGMDGLGDPVGRAREAECETTYRTHLVRLRRLARLLLHDPHEAEEVVQETFVKMLRAWDGAARPEAWGPWLTRLTVNGCRDRYRSGWWRLLQRRPATLDGLDLVDPRPSPDREAVAGEVRDRIWEIFRRLPVRQREVFVLRHFEGWSTDDVAASLGLRPGSVKRHLFRAVQRLRAVLGEQR